MMIDISNLNLHCIKKYIERTERQLINRYKPKKFCVFKPKKKVKLDSMNHIKINEQIKFVETTFRPKLWTTSYTILPSL